MDNNWRDNEQEAKVFSGPKNFVRLSMSEGEYSIRVLGAPKLYRYHWIDAVNRTVICGPDCELCLSGDRGQLRYVVNVIDRKDGVVKMWEFGRRVKASIMYIAEKYGDPINYDLIVNRKGMKAEDTVYTILPAREENPLTEEEKKMGTYDLEKLYAITPKETVEAYLGGVIPERKDKEIVETKDKENNKIVTSGDNDLPTLD